MMQRILKLSGLIFVVIVGILSIVASGPFPCAPGEKRETCWGGGQLTWCCKPASQTSSCCAIERGFKGLSEVPKPDLSSTNLDGLVDFGQTILKVQVSDGDKFESNMKGRIAIVGGVCAEPRCPLDVLFVELAPLEDNLMTTEGRAVSGVIVRNVDTWKGYRESNGTIKMIVPSQLAIEATVDNREMGTILDANEHVTGELFYNVLRTSDPEPRESNLIRIEGSFADDDIEAELSISIWATDCQTAVSPDADCRTNLEPGLPGTVRFDSNFLMLKNLQSSQDLCDALLVEDYEEICVSESGEFPAFACQQQPIPSEDNEFEMAELLDFDWQDANGTTFGKEHVVSLDRMPSFPVRLTVTNRWGKTVSAAIAEPPVCYPSIPLASGACAWEGYFGSSSHSRGRPWCPAGTFLTALDLDADRTYTPGDTPLVGYARCCAPTDHHVDAWGDVQWLDIGAISHHKVDNWCPDGSYITAVDLDSGPSEMDFPIIGGAQCSSPARPENAGYAECWWVEIGRRSHIQAGDWCPADAFLTALDLDSVAGASGYDSPIVGRAQCCRMASGTP